MPGAGVKHGFNSKSHTFHQRSARAGAAVVKHLGFFMENAADAVTTIFPNNGIVVGLPVLLNNMTDIAERDSRSYQTNGLVKTFPCDTNQASGVVRDLANTEHFAGISMKPLLNDSDVNINDVAGL